MESIINLGYDFRHNIVYLTELDGVYRLYIGYYGLGTILDSDTSQPEVLFKELISSLKKELGVFESFVFPCET